MIRGVHHVAIHARDIEAMIAFYTEALGFRLAARFEWGDDELIDDIVGLKGSAAKAAMLNAGNVHIEVFEYARPAPPEAEPLRPCDRGYTHFCLEVTDIEAEWERLSRLGLTFRRRPVDLGDVKAIYGKDPEGNIIEIQQILPADHEFAFDRLRLPPA